MEVTLSRRAPPGAPKRPRLANRNHAGRTRRRRICIARTSGTATARLGAPFLDHDRSERRGGEMRIRNGFVVAPGRATRMIPGDHVVEERALYVLSRRRR